MNRKFHSFFHSSTRQGVSIVETLIALLILSVMGVVIIGITLQLQSVTTTAFLRNQANSLAEQGLEQVRGFVQVERFTELYNKGDKCFSDGNLNSEILSLPKEVSCQSSVCVGGSDVTGTTNFRRSVYLEKFTGSSYSVKVSSKVCWVDRNKCNLVTAETYYYQY